MINFILYLHHVKNEFFVCLIRTQFSAVTKIEHVYIIIVLFYQLFISFRFNGANYSPETRIVQFI